MRAGVLAGVASGAAMVAVLTFSASLLLPPPAESAASLADPGPGGAGAGAAARLPADAPNLPPVEKPTAPQTLPSMPEATPPPAASLPAEAVPLPSASEFNRKLEDGAVRIPETETPGRVGGVAGGLDTAPHTESGIVMPDPGTQSASRPEPPVVIALTEAPAASSAPIRPMGSEDAVPARLEAKLRPDMSAEDRAGFKPEPPAAATEPSVPAAPATESAPDRDAFAADPAPGRPSASGPVATIVAPPPRTRIALVPEAGILAPPPAERPVAEIVPDPVDSGPKPRRLLLDSERVVAASVSTKRGEGALVENAVAFDNPEGLPRLAIVLIDVMQAADDSRFAPVGPVALNGLDLPVTIAIDPTRPDAAGAAGGWRDAGYEVVLLAPAPVPGATAQDVEIALEGARAAMPQAIGLLDLTQESQTGLPARTALLPALAEAGMGFVGPAEGLGSAVAAARRSGIPAASLYRMLDGGGESAAGIARNLDRAAIEAERVGALVVAGHATEGMIAALRDWRGTPRAPGVAIAPLSAMLLDGSHGTGGNGG